MRSRAWIVKEHKKCRPWGQCGDNLTGLNVALGYGSKAGNQRSNLTRWAAGLRAQRERHNASP